MKPFVFDLLNWSIKSLNLTISSFVSGEGGRICGGWWWLKERKLKSALFLMPIMHDLVIRKQDGFSKISFFVDIIL